jgi:hypothetical protein
VTLSEIRTEDLLSDIPCTYGCSATVNRGTAVAQWLRCYVTNLKVAGSITDGVIGIFH